MINLIISFVIIALVMFRLRPTSDRVKKNAYKWWYIPWLGVIYSLIIYSLYKGISVSTWPFLSIFVQDFQLEAAVSLVAMVVLFVLLP